MPMGMGMGGMGMGGMGMGMGMGGGIRQAITAAGPNISRSEMSNIVSAAGGNVQKAVNKISQAGANLNSGAANMLIKAPPATGFGETRLGRTLQSMVGTPSSSGRFVQGQRVGAVQGTPGTGLVPGGMMIRPGGNLAVRRTPAPQVTPQPTSDPSTTTTPEEPVVSNPYQDLIDSVLGQISGLNEQANLNSQYMQDYINQSQLAAQQQMDQMTELFNAQIAQQEQAYAEQVALANQQALADQEASRAFMINQGRMVSPANLQIGATYGTPQLAGTQGFKYSPQRTTTTPAQVASAFTAPTLAAAATTPTQQLQPTVLNV